MPIQRRLNHICLRNILILFSPSIYFSVTRVVSSDLPTKVYIFLISIMYASYIILYLIALGLVYQTTHRRVPNAVSFIFPAVIRNVTHNSSVFLPQNYRPSFSRLQSDCKLERREQELVVADYLRSLYSSWGIPLPSSSLSVFTSTRNNLGLLRLRQSPDIYWIDSKAGPFSVDLFPTSV
jgi:hypothetical protein